MIALMITLSSLAKMMIIITLSSLAKSASSSSSVSSMPMAAGSSHRNGESLEARRERFSTWEGHLYDLVGTICQEQYFNLEIYNHIGEILVETSRRPATVSGSSQGKYWTGAWSKLRLVANMPLPNIHIRINVP